MSLNRAFRRRCEAYRPKSVTDWQNRKWLWRLREKGLL